MTDSIIVRGTTPSLIVDFSDITDFTVSEITAAAKLDGALYGRIKVNDGVKFNGVPVERIADNVLGYYDTVSGNFYTNQGTGSVTEL